MADRLWVLFLATTILGWVGAGRSACADASSTVRDSTTNFDFIYEEGRGTGIDTYRNVYTKDLINRPDTTIRLVLNEQEMERVRSKMVAIGFFDMEEPHPPYPVDSVMTIIRPRTTKRLEATLGGRSRRMLWDTGRGMHHETPAWKGLRELARLIREILDNRPEAKALPQPRGGYL